MADTLQGTVVPASTLCIPSGMVGPPGQRITASASLVAAAPPSNPGQGQFWFDGTRFYVRDNAWVQVGRSLLATASRWQLRFNHAGCVWSSVAYGDGRFVVVSSSSPAPSGSYTVATSTDGMSWRFSTVSGNLTGPAWNSVCYGGGLFFAVATTGQAGTWAMSSPDGITWTGRGGMARPWTAVGYAVIPDAADRFVAVTDTSAPNNANHLSIDALGTWNASGSILGGYNTTSIAFGFPYHVGMAPANFGAGQVPVIRRTLDGGLTWGFFNAGGARDFTSVTYGNGRFVVVGIGAANQVGMSTDQGLNWSFVTAPNLEWRGVTYGNGVFVAVASSGAERVMTSPDGLTWESHLCPLAPWSDITFGNGLFVAVSSDGQIMTSR